MSIERCKILVTGGAGFIGSHVCEEILSRGCLPVVLDNLSSGKVENLPPGCELIVANVQDDLVELTDICQRVDAVVHLAAEPSVVKSVQEPIETHLSNYVGTLNLLEAMRYSGLRRIVYASSAAVYPPDNSPQREDGPVKPSSPYGLDKLMGEHAIRMYGNLHGVQGTALRFFNIYGERQDPTSPYSGVISIFLSRIDQGQPITIFGTGEQSRDFVYVKDLARLIVNILDDPSSPDVMNVGTGSSTTLLELASTLEGVFGEKADIHFGPPRQGDILHSLADTSRLKPHWLPRTSLKDGLRSLAGDQAAVRA